MVTEENDIEPHSAMTVETQYVHALAAFLSMEPADSVISLAREYSGGSITSSIQRFFFERCVIAAADGNTSYTKKFLKKLINEVESENGEVLDEVYEEYALYMSSMKDDKILKENTRVCKVISFLYPEGLDNNSSNAKRRALVIPLKCSLNMLEGDTGCSIWPSSLFLSEFVLSFPDLFAGKACLEVGSGVGLVGICLAHVKASKVILSDGDLLTLTNMKLNLEVNHMNHDNNTPQQSDEAQRIIECVHLPWESASEAQLLKYSPDIILGADVIYDPSYLPHLVRVLAILLRRQPARSTQNKDENSVGEQQRGPVAYIASVIRNPETFDRFVLLVNKAGLSISDITGKLKPLEFLPYMQRSYDRSSVRLFSISST